MKTKEELAAIREKEAALRENTAELTDEELEQVTGGSGVLSWKDSDSFFTGVYSDKD